ncbi:MAG: hypothetical protein OSJ66_04995 [Clostridia bacterium]|nr:hypothetical protein [Clostridia bacterium]
MKKKLVTILLIAVIVFNFIGTSFVYADEPDDSAVSLPESNGEGEITGEQYQQLADNGTDDEGNKAEVTPSILGTIFQSISLMLNSFPMTVNALMTHLAKNPTGTEDPLKEAVEYVVDLVDVSTYFSIQRTVFNEVALFNIDVFNMDSTYKVGIGDKEQEIHQTPALINLKESTAKWFYICRLLAIMINLCVLIYVGIRMAISTVATEEARYKKMLISWAESMVILFFLQYIMTFAIQLGNIVLNIIYNLREGLNSESFEEVIMAKIFRFLSESSGMQTFMYSVFFWFLVLMQAKFFLTYLKRVLSVMFLTIISPFITVTFSIDKMGDNKAQAFDTWMKEYIINISLQPIHAAIYLVFVFTAGEIAATAPFVAMVFLLVLGRLEKIVRDVFGITNATSIKNFDEEFKSFGKGGGHKKRKG